jgi:hypothetical protein
MFQKKNKDFLFELAVSILTTVLIMLLVSALLVISSVPINNYHHASGYIEFKTQCKVVPFEEGIIQRAFVKQNDHIKKGDSLFQFYSEGNMQKLATLNIHLKYLDNELKSLQNLARGGAIPKRQIDKKRLEIDELSKQKDFLEREIIFAPFEGIIHYMIMPEYIKGTFVEKGEILAYIFSSTEKHIRISFPNEFADRFKMGSRVLIKYRDPTSLKIKKMNGLIYKSFVNDKNGTMELFCEVVDNRQLLESFQPFTMVDAYIAINRTSLSYDIFGFDLFPFFHEAIANSHAYEYLKSNF